MVRAEPDPFPPLRARHRVLAALRTDRGLERSDNQDNAAIVDLTTGTDAEGAREVAPGALLAAVCDGMGGEAGGALASALGLHGIVRAMTAERDDARVAQALVLAVEQGARCVRRAAADDPHLARMGTTATVAVLGSGALFVAQVGDSRAYVLRGRDLVQVTRDQTMLELLRASGADVPPDAVGANVILQALGASTRLEVIVTRTPLARGDVVLLCSDGLHGVVSGETITAILRDHEPAAACEALVAAAHANGAPDNVTCVVLRVDGELLPSDDAAPAPIVVGR